MSRAYNFSAGPATLPQAVLEQARDEMLDFRGAGASIVELSHRGPEFMQVAAAPSIGNLEAGALASVTSLRFSIVSGGVACVAGCLLLALAFPALLRYDGRADAET